MATQLNCTATKMVTMPWVSASFLIVLTTDVQFATDHTTNVPISTTLSTPGCPEGWHLLSDYCYTIHGFDEGQQLDFRDAEAACQQLALDTGGSDGHLASIPYDGINALFTAFMKTSPVDTWIGLWTNGGSGELTWIDSGFRYGYDNFARRQPDIDLDQDVCIKMLNDPHRPGEWVDVFCTNEYNAYACQMPSDPMWDLNQPNRCVNTEYQSYYLSCYKFVTDEKTYSDAKRYCADEGATLASFPDRYELAFGETVMHYNKVDPIWLGMERDDNGLYRWVDGWPLTYTDWYRNEPTDGGCAAMTFDGWKDLDCMATHAFFCKITEEEPPSTIPPQVGHCPGAGFVLWKDNCYFFPETASSTDWDTANYMCQSKYKAGTLASIHSDDEGLFLRSQSTMEWGSPWPFWIGLEIDNDGYYHWKDNSLVDYQNWRQSDGEPNITWPDGGRGCAYIPSESTDWHDDQCQTSKHFVCKGALDALSWEPGCPSGWYGLNDTCYILIWNSTEYQKTFYEAEEDCAMMALGGHLAKIEFDVANALITSFTKNLAADVWIGLHTNGNDNFRWISDESLPIYTNWASGPPSVKPNHTLCAKMFNVPEMPGEWAEVHCNEQKNAYICMQPTDPYIPAKPPNGTLCARPDYQSYYHSCYKLVEEATTYYEAKDACIDDNAIIASFIDKYEQAFGITTMYANQVESVWLGLEEDSDTGTLEWVDGWPLTYTEWKPNEPIARHCVLLTRDGWEQVPRNETHGYFCKYTQDVQPEIEPNPPGYCPQPWDRFGNNCYHFDESSVAETFNLANSLCQSRFGGTLVSIHSDQEAEFIRTTTTGRFGADEPLWLGLRKDGAGSYSWIDNSLIDYWNWNANPNKSTDGCAYMIPSEATWAEDSCTASKRYACKAPLMCEKSSSTSITVPVVISVIVGTMVGVFVTLAVGAMVIKSKRIRSNPENDTSLEVSASVVHRPTKPQKPTEPDETQYEDTEMPRLPPAAGYDEIDLSQDPQQSSYPSETEYEDTAMPSKISGYMTTPQLSTNLADTEYEDTEMVPKISSSLQGESHQSDSGMPRDNTGYESLGADKAIPHYQELYADITE